VYQLVEGIAVVDAADLHGRTLMGGRSRGAHEIL
jgi:hypothetical protein